MAQGAGALLRKTHTLRRQRMEIDGRVRRQGCIRPPTHAASPYVQRGLERPGRRILVSTVHTHARERIFAGRGGGAEKKSGRKCVRRGVEPSRSLSLTRMTSPPHALLLERCKYFSYLVLVLGVAQKESRRDANSFFFFIFHTRREQKREERKKMDRYLQPIYVCAAFP